MLGSPSLIGSAHKRLESPIQKRYDKLHEVEVCKGGLEKQPYYSTDGML
jgi:hypothetical protein